MIWLQDPSASLLYTNNWDDGYLTTGETLTTSSWTVSSTKLTVVSSTAFTNLTASIKITGGTHGEMYYLTNRVTTSNAQTDERTIYVKIWEPR